MQSSIAGKKKKWIMGSVAGVLTAAIVSTALYKDVSVVLARPSLPGIETIVNNNSSNNPFYILEIVDNYGSARTGYTIAGEEPGYYDENGVAALSDMASYGERKDNYMNGTATDPSVDPATAGFTELKDYAFTYEAFDQGPDPLVDPENAYNKDTEEVRNFSAYGTFEENVNNPADGKYDPADLTGDYKQVNDGTEATKDNLTIDQVYNRLPGSDQTGYFYMHYANLNKADDTSDPAKRYNIKEYKKLTTQDSWMFPFFMYEEDPALDDSGDPIKDSNDNTVKYRYYHRFRYVPNVEFEVEKDLVDPDDQTDDIYKLKNSYDAGDVIYRYADGTESYRYYGYIAKDSSDELRFYPEDGSADIPITGGLEDDGTGNYVPVDSLAYRIEDTGDELFTMRSTNDNDGAGVDKYYLDEGSIEQDANGLYELSTYRFEAVNDPDYLPENFGIVDESEQTWSGSPAWYHVWYYKSASNSPYIYNPKPYDGTYDFVHDYTQPEVNNFYYKGGYKNNEKFKKEVLDVDSEDVNNICVDVITKKLADVTKEDIEKANLIYFTGKGEYGKDADGNWIDMNYEAAAALITAVDKDHKAVIIDLTATGVRHDFLEVGKNYRTVVQLLLQNSIKGISQYVDEDDWKISDSKSTELMQLGMEYYTNASTTKNEDLSHVVDSVFINDNNHEERTEAIAKDFEKPYSDDKVDGFTLRIGTTDITYDGFKDVKADIEEEKFYLEVAGKTVSDFNDKINKATSIRYILNFGNKRTVSKNSIRVLDLEPFYSREVEGDPEDYMNIDALSVVSRPGTNGNNNDNRYNITNIAQIRDIFTKKWFTTNVVSKDTAKDIDVTGMGTREFIGKIEDLNENYDLIYIGMDTAYMNTTYTSINGRRAAKTKQVVWNLGNDYHYVYSHTGDIMKPTQVSQSGGPEAGGGTFNTSGNDITPDKLRELENYVKSGYAVILSDEIFDIDQNTGKVRWNDETYGIDTSRIEKDSYLYQFIKFCVTEKKGNDYKYLYKNVDITRNFEGTAQTATTDNRTALSHRETFVKYLNISKLTVNAEEIPPLYNPYTTSSNDVHEYLSMNAQGKYTLDFKVELTNDAAVDTTKTSYDCKLYIDHDADGRFEDVEALDSLDIFNDDNGDYISIRDDNKYHLTTGTKYRISREVPEGYVGLIPWKLVFIENRDDEDAQIKSAIQDYSAITDLANKPTIRVLQLTSFDRNNANGFNDGAGGNNNHLNLRDDNTLKGLYEKVTEFNLSVDKLPVKDYIEKQGTVFGNGKTRLENLNTYDIVVFGFSDSYWFSAENSNRDYMAKVKEAILSIREYVLSGKSVLFTHDLTSPLRSENDSARFGMFANRYLRDIQGMDRYGYVRDNVLANQTLTVDGAPLSEYKSAYDDMLRVDSAVTSPANIGYTNQCILRWNSGNTQYGDIAAPWTRTTGVTHDNTDERQLKTVKRLNRGQMTEYPFRIGAMTQSGESDSEGRTLFYANEYIQTATTHHQWFQLNMETDYTDENYDDDVVVWYTITEPGTSKANYHKLDSDDARNNYYIYNKGNITYTGAGHALITDDGGAEEKKLFVNTLVASYNAGKHAPYAAYKSNETRTATDISSTYIPYDMTLSKLDDDTNEGDLYSHSGWLQDTVTVYFKAVNNNLQDNKDPLVTQYYVEVPTGGDLTIGSTHYKIITPVAGSVKACKLVNGAMTYTDVTDPQVLSNGLTYKMDFRVSDLMNGDLNAVNTRYHAVISTRMRSQSKGKTVDDDKRDMAATGTVASLPANDSMKPLNINFTQLYDLK